MTIRTSRRAFVGAALPAALASRAQGANDRIRLGVIGTGSRGVFLLGELQKCQDYNIAVNAVCDVWRPNRERAARIAQETWGAAPRETTDYRDLLSWEDVDAVLISTPDFTHSRILKEAVEAGKDVYCEKPMGVDFNEAKAAYLAVKRSRQVVQIGTQRRSDGQFVAAAGKVQSGILGKVTRVETAVNFYEPRWRRDYSGVTGADVDWDRFRFGGRRVPFDPRRLRQWQLYRDYTNGIPGLWMSHFIDLIPWFLGDPYPASATANGGVYLWKDGRETYDVFHALLDYPQGVLVGFAMSLTNTGGNRNHWYGTRGTLDMDKFEITGAGGDPEDHIEGTVQMEAESVNSHMANFLECVRSRRQPRADVQAGFSHSAAGCMCAMARDSGRRVRFDADRLEVV